MASTQQLKRRIGSVKNTKQITKAMELVAASKMRKATESAHRGRSYRQYAHSMLARLNKFTEISENALYRKREVSKKLYIVISSNRGLAGAYNSNIIKAFTTAIQKDRRNKVSSSVIVIGKRGAQFLNRVEGINILAVYDEFSDKPSANDIRPILNTVIEQYSDELVDQIDIIYTEHKSNIVQTVEQVTVLPASLQDDMEVSDTEIELDVSNFTFEPSIKDVLDNVTERLLEVQIWQALLESIASEQSMRMLSMKNATDNASEIIDDLTLEFNTARQSKITQELAEITGGVEAMK